MSLLSLPAPLEPQTQCCDASQTRLSMFPLARGSWGLCLPSMRVHIAINLVNRCENPAPAGFGTFPPDPRIGEKGDGEGRCTCSFVFVLSSLSQRRLPPHRAGPRALYPMEYARGNPCCHPQSSPRPAGRVAARRTLGIPKVELNVVTRLISLACPPSQRARR